MVLIYYVAKHFNIQTWDILALHFCENSVVPSYNSRMNGFDILRC